MPFKYVFPFISFSRSSSSTNYIHVINPCNINFMNNIHKEKNSLKEVNTRRRSWEKTKENIHDKENKNSKEYANVCIW